MFSCLTRKKKLEFNPETFKPESTYTFRLVIEGSDQFAKPGVTEQIIRVNQFASLSIQCQQNCLPKVNPQQLLSLEARCKKCVSFSFAWEVFRTSLQQDIYPVNDEIPLDCYVYGKNNYRFVLNYDCLKSGYAYRVLLKVRGPSYTLEALYSFKVNSAPSVGKCAVSPQEGETMRTRFYINCTGFEDEDLPLEYSFSYNNEYNLDITVKNNLPHVHAGILLKKRYTPESEAVFLPAGHPERNYAGEITIAVEDYYGMMTVLHLNVTVKPPKDMTTGELASVILSNNPGSFSDILQTEGDVEGALNMAYSAAKLLNSQNIYKISGEDTAKMKKNLFEGINTIQTETFGKTKEVLYVLDTVLEGDVKLLPADTVERAASKLESLTNNIMTQLDEENLSGATTFEAAIASMSVASSVLSAGAQFDTLPTVETSIVVKPPETTEKKQICSASSKIVSIVDSLANMVLDQAVKGQEENYLDSSEVSVWVRKEDTRGYEDNHIGQKGVAQAHIPSIKSMGVNTEEQNTLHVKLMNYPTNPYQCAEGSELINSNVIVMNIDEIVSNGTKRRVTIASKAEHPVDFKVKRKGVPEGVKSTISTKGLPEITNDNVRVHSFNLKSRKSASHILIERENTDFSLLVTLSYREYPNYTQFSNTPYVVTPYHPKKHLLTILPEDNVMPDTGLYYVGLLPYTKSVRTYLERNSDNNSFAFENNFTDTVLDYTITIFVSRCMFYDKKIWSEEGCKVGNRTDVEFVHCRCSHLSIFGASFLVAPNHLDMSRIPELFATASQNLVVIIFMTVCWTLFLILLIWAIRRDRLDANKKGILHLEDNSTTAPYGYIIAFYTGLRWNAGTTSKVSIKLHGRRRATSERVIKSRKRKFFEKGGQDWFFLRTPVHLGEIVGVTLVIQFTGSSPSWYLSQIRLKDVATGTFWVFLVNEWYKTEDGNGKMEDFVTPLTTNELRKFNIVLRRRAVNDLRERHLWFSIFNFPPRSQFTRAQRLACAFSLLLLAMLVNIMFYGVLPERSDATFRDDNIKFLIFSINIKAIVVGVESSLLAFPFGFLILEMFAHIKYPKLTEEEQIKNLEWEHEVDANEDNKDDISSHSSDTSGKVISPPKEYSYPSPDKPESGPVSSFMQKLFISRDKNFIRPTIQQGDAPLRCPELSRQFQGKHDLFWNNLFNETDYHYPIPMSTYHDFSPQAEVTSLQDVDMNSDAKRCKRILLPHFFLYVAWFVAMSTSLLCTFFIMLYGLTYGYQKSLDWLMSNVFSLGQSTVLLDPLHVLVFAIVMAYCVELAER